MTKVGSPYHEYKAQVVRKAADLFEQYGNGIDMNIVVHFFALTVTLSQRNNDGLMVRQETMNIDLQSGDVVNLFERAMIRALKKMGAIPHSPYPDADGIRVAHHLAEPAHKAGE
jgi:hypothetical protein